MVCERTSWELDSIPPIKELAYANLLQLSMLPMDRACSPASNAKLGNGLFIPAFWRRDHFTYLFLRISTRNKAATSSLGHENCISENVAVATIQKCFDGFCCAISTVRPIVTSRVMQLEQVQNVVVPKKVGRLGHRNSSLSAWWWAGGRKRIEFTYFAAVHLLPCWYTPTQRRCAIHDERSTVVSPTLVRSRVYIPCMRDGSNFPKRYQNVPTDNTEIRIRSPSVMVMLCLL
jgi:hypothetical protein